MAKTLTKEQKQELAEFRDRIGGITPVKRDIKKQLDQDKKAIVAVLTQNPSSVPQIAEQTALSPQRVFWCLAGMRKYGLVSDAEGEDDYLVYTLIENK